MGNFWRGTNVFVTGATGMIGAFLVSDLLSKGSNVVALVKDSEPGSELYRSGNINHISVVNGCLEDFTALENAINIKDIEIVFHLGAQTIVGAAHRFPLHTFEANIRGTYNLLDACRVHSDSVKGTVIASSDKAYGEQEELPYTEEAPLKGRHPYEVSKSCADMLAQSYNHTYGLRIGIARCGNVYGGNDLNFSRIVPGTIRSLMHGEPPEIRSDGTYIRDYIYVKDVARAYMQLAESLGDDNVNGEAFNFGTQRPIEVLELVAAIQKLMNLEEFKPVITSTARGEIENQYLDSGKAHQMLGWRPRYSLEEGLKETIAWYEEYFRCTIRRTDNEQD